MFKVAGHARSWPEGGALVGCARARCSRYLTYVLRARRVSGPQRARSKTQLVSERRVCLGSLGTFLTAAEGWREEVVPRRDETRAGAEPSCEITGGRRKGLVVDKMKCRSEGGTVGDERMNAELVSHKESGAEGRAKIEQRREQRSQEDADHLPVSHWGEGRIVHKPTAAATAHRVLRPVHDLCHLRHTWAPGGGKDDQRAESRREWLAAASRAGKRALRQVIGRTVSCILTCSCAAP